VKAAKSVEVRGQRTVDGDIKLYDFFSKALYKYRHLLRHLRDFAKGRGSRYIGEMNLESVRDFRSGWADQNLSALKKLERLRAFFRFCQDSNWVPDNPAKKLKNPKVTQSPTMPFTKEQMASILGACQDYPDRRNAARLRACSPSAILGFADPRCRHTQSRPD
jgi:site-specific recombinase XerD